MQYTLHRLLNATIELPMTKTFVLAAPRPILLLEMSIKEQNIVKAQKHFV